MEDTSNDFKNWEEEIFWTHFQFIHFSQFLNADFLQRLEIPKKFSKNIKKKLPETVTLKGPSGVIWDVGLTAYNDDTLFFDGGWTTFVKDHSLDENDFLIFKYNGISHFDVLMFDGNSLCEKASCYFVKKRMYTESDHGHQSKRKVIKNPDEIVHNSSQCGLESSPEKSIDNEIGVRSSRKPINSAASNKKKKIQNSGSGTWSIRPKRSLGGKELSTFPGELKVERLETEYEHTAMANDSENEHTTMDGDVNGSLWHASGNRVATRDEKLNALTKAQEALTDEGFMVVMKPTHVLRKFYMSVPSAWATKYLPKENANVILRMNKHTWKIRYNFIKNRDSGGLSGGWRKFVNDNYLVEHDVCVFEPANLGKKPLILDVNIFHVLQDALPLSKADPLPCSSPDIVEASLLGAGF